MDSAKYMNMK